MLYQTPDFNIVSIDPILKAEALFLFFYAEKSATALIPNRVGPQHSGVRTVN